MSSSESSDSESSDSEEISNEMVLRELYYDNEQFHSQQNLYKAARERGLAVSRGDIKRWLEYDTRNVHYE